ncbi:MAG: hypothetical protein KF767_11490 [Bdellovibrionaceae bacterium]|nr:hypothetical protein [Pseudobdellovibrionaceae bacterium]
MTKRLPIFLMLFVIFSAAPGWSLTETERTQLRSVREWYPQQACRESRELGQCFRWAASDCESKTTKAIDACLKRLDRKTRGSASGDLAYWERQVLVCAFNDLRGRYGKIFVGGAMCDMSGGAE